MIVVVFILCIILGFLLAKEVIGGKKFNEKENTFISFLYLLLNAGTNLGIALVYGEPYWPFYISASGWGIACISSIKKSLKVSSFTLWRENQSRRKFFRINARISS